MLSLEPVPHDLNLRLVGFFEQLEDAGVAELAVDAAFGVICFVVFCKGY